MPNNRPFRFRPTSKDDLPRIEAINKFGFKLTPGELSLVDGVIVNSDDEIVSFGIVKPMAEATFLTDMSFPQAARVSAMKQMLDIAFSKTREFGVKQLHVFCEEQRLADALLKHYQFELCKGIILVKNL